MRNASGQQGENERKGIQAANFFVSTYDIFFIKCVTRKFHNAATTTKKCTNKCAACAKLNFLLIRPIEHFCCSCFHHHLPFHYFIF